MNPQYTKFLSKQEERTGSPQLDRVIEHLKINKIAKFGCEIL
jgi:hypothetical protein